MAQKPPITVVNSNTRTSPTRARNTTAPSAEPAHANSQPQKRTAPATNKKNSRKSGKRSKQMQGKRAGKKLPAWFLYLLMGCIAVLFLAGFYYFFIRPYAYRWKPCYG